jgi:uncharacterized protein
MPMEPLPDLATLSLTQIAQLVAEKKLPPVEKWNPEHCGHSEMRIAADGTWFHQGSPIGRPEMVRLFSTILRREADGSFVLVTPVEKMAIDVEDAPFVAVELREEREGEVRTLAFRLNTGEIVVADAEHAIVVREGADGPRPYLHVRGGLEAVIARPVYYELAAMALDDGGEPSGRIGVHSGGTFFPLEPDSGA